MPKIKLVSTVFVIDKKQSSYCCGYFKEAIEQSHLPLKGDKIVTFSKSDTVLKNPIPINFCPYCGREIEIEIEKEK